MKKIIASIAAVGICASAVADEVWSTPIGDVVYEKDIGDVAVLSFPLEDEELRGHVFISGLGGNYDDRGHFTGYWSEPMLDDGGLCGMTIIDGNGETTNNWGRITITFLDTGFPSSWVAVRGDCFEEPNSHLVGNPVVAPGVR